MDWVIQAALYEAALKAAKEMVGDLLKMSCFVSNWEIAHEVMDEELLEAA